MTALELFWPLFMAYPHYCTCTDSPIMGTGSNKVNRQLIKKTEIKRVTDAKF